MVFTSVTIDSSYNIVVSMYDEAVATVEAGKYMIVKVVIGDSMSGSARITGTTTLEIID